MDSNHLKEKTFTLVPVGGLGNRILAIVSALCFCKEKHRRLEIVWFKDPGLNCAYDKLFHLETSVDVHIRNAKGLDFLLKDKPRKLNLWLPRFFETHFFDKCIYYYDDDFDMQSDASPSHDSRLDSFQKIYMLACSMYWKTTEMFQVIKPCPEILKKVEEITRRFSENTIGLHIRRTDNLYAIEHSPTELYIKAIEDEIKKDRNVKFFLATDSIKEKKHIIYLYGDKIITSPKVTRRNTEDGIMDAFVEMIALSSTNKIYAGGSSFAYVAQKLSGTEIKLFLKPEYR